MNYSITPEQFLREIGWTFKRRANWLTLRYCPFCTGGDSKDIFTFAVHITGGNFFCHRQKCGVKGSFWKLIESQNKNPRDYAERAKSKKRFVYGK